MQCIVVSCLSLAFNPTCCAGACRPKALEFEGRQSRLAAASARREREAALRTLRAAEAALAAAADALPPLREARDAAARDAAAAREGAGAGCEQVAALRKEVDIRIAAFMEVGGARGRAVARVKPRRREGARRRRGGCVLARVRGSGARQGAPLRASRPLLPARPHTHAR
jgi:hypothetical protein